jgi:hypothetical protein
MTSHHRNRLLQLGAVLLGLGYGLLLSAPLPALAEPPHKAAASATAAKARPRTTRMSFLDGDDILASPDQGAGSLVTGERTPRRSSLIHIRQSFIPELIKSAENI